MLNINSNTVLTREEIKRIAPSIFTDHALEKMSDKYTHLSTAVVIDDMEKLGWNVISCKEIKARKRKGYQKHMLVFRHPDINITSEDGDVVFPQVLVTNSHDGTSSFIFRCGIFRMICENGMVIATQDFSSLKIRHMGYSFEELQKGIQTITETLPVIVGRMNNMIDTKMDERTAEEFAAKSLALRFPNSTTIQVDLKDFLKPTRKEDEGSNLWSIFNIVEEKLIRGNLQYTNEKGKQRKLRPIKNFQQDIQLNEQLWQLAETYCN